MDHFAQLKNEERRDYFEVAADHLGNMSAHIVQKDFWVCWTLKQLFSLADIGEHLTFKGGTSLSKVYGIIKRFSEDIDVAIEREYLGFGADKDPATSTGSKDRQRRLEKLKETCQEFVRTKILPALSTSFATVLNGQDWRLNLDPDDVDQQTILFTFPNAIATGTNSYVRPVVKIELGARSDHWPVHQATISPYLFEALPDSLQQPTANIKVLAAERTFWEKATILHMLYHLPDDKTFPLRMSRHYYDFYMLLKSEVKDLALKNMDLLKRVAEHKSVFFRAGWAKYEEAQPGTLRLSPPPARKSDLKADFSAMTPMLFEDSASFEMIEAEIAKFEAQLNKK